MKKNIKHFSLIGFLLVSLLAMATLQAQDTKQVLIEKSFNISPSATLKLSSEFGQVFCKNWDKQEISVKITGIAKTGNEEKAQKAISRIQYTVDGNSNEVTVTCKLTGNDNGNKPEVSTDIEIFMPKSINLDLKHKFGAAVVEVVEGNGFISSEYGSFKAKSILGADSRVKISFGDGRINSFGGKNASISYSKFSVETAGDFSLSSEYSEVDATSIGYLNLKQEGGELNILKVKGLSGTSNMSSLNIERLEDKIAIKTSYGSVNIDKVDAGFSELNISNDYGSVNAYIPPEASYSIDAMAVYGSFNYPESLAELNYREVTDSKSIYRGIIGKGKSPLSKATVETRYGSVNFKGN